MVDNIKQNNAHKASKGRDTYKKTQLHITYHYETGVNRGDKGDLRWL